MKQAPFRVSISRSIGSRVSKTVAASVINSTTDAYSADILRQLNGAPQSAIMWTGSLNAFSSYHFEIQSKGTSARNAATQNFQGVAIIAQMDSTVLGDPNAGATKLQ